VGEELAPPAQATPAPVEDAGPATQATPEPSGAFADVFGSIS
jgi:hypothetical protein